MKPNFRRGKYHFYHLCTCMSVINGVFSLLLNSKVLTFWCSCSTDDWPVFICREIFQCIRNTVQFIKCHSTSGLILEKNIPTSYIMTFSILDPVTSTSKNLFDLSTLIIISALDFWFYLTVFSTHFHSSISMCEGQKSPQQIFDRMTHPKMTTKGGLCRFFHP